MSSSLVFPTRFFDDNGNPLSGGWVFSYYPSTSTTKLTYSDAALTDSNSMPTQLDAGGFGGSFYGSGIYRIVVQDSNFNTIYDLNVSAFALDSAISPAVAPGAAAVTLASARQLWGIDDAINNAISNVSLITGPASTTPGPTGPTGPAGADGSAGGISSANIDIQSFSSSGTWTKPSVGGITMISIWGAGGAGTDASPTNNGGGGGGFISIICKTSSLPSTVAITCGTGGIFVSGSAAPGANGSDTTVGSYLTMRGGAGGSLTKIGANGYLSQSSGIVVLGGSSEYGLQQQSLSYFDSRIGDMSPVAGSNQPMDGYGNPYFVQPFAPTPGGSNAIGSSPASIPTIFGGQGGGYPGSPDGAFPGGGGFGGNGGNARVILVTY